MHFYKTWRRDVVLKYVDTQEQRAHYYGKHANTEICSEQNSVSIIWKWVVHIVTTDLQSQAVSIFYLLKVHPRICLISPEDLKNLLTNNDTGLGSAQAPYRQVLQFACTNHTQWIMTLRTGSAACHWPSFNKYPVIALTLHSVILYAFHLDNNSFINNHAHGTLGKNGERIYSPSVITSH